MDMIEGVWGDILFGVRMVFFYIFKCWIITIRAVKSRIFPFCGNKIIF